MKIRNLSILLGLVLGTTVLTPVMADTSYKKEFRSEKRHSEGKIRPKKLIQNKKLQPHKRQNVQKRVIRSGQPNRIIRNNKLNSKSNNRNYQRYDNQRSYTKPKIRHNYQPRYTKSQDGYRNDRYTTKRHIYPSNHRDNRRYEYRRGHRLLWVTPRQRTFRNVHIVRPFGHSYFGYGHYINDSNAWRWLAFTAITLKLLDMVDEQSQREHESAQIEATTADVGERIYWDTEDASGYVETTRQGTNSRGLQCREYQQSITVDGETERAYGTACLQPDGSWKVTD